MAHDYIPITSLEMQEQWPKGGRITHQLFVTLRDSIQAKAEEANGQKQNTASALTSDEAILQANQTRGGKDEVAISLTVAGKEHEVRMSYKNGYENLEDGLYLHKDDKDVVKSWLEAEYTKHRDGARYKFQRVARGGNSSELSR